MNRIELLRVGDFMKREFLSVFACMSLRRVVKLLIEENVEGIPVIDIKENYLGLITRKELTKFFLPRYLITEPPLVGSLEDVLPVEAFYGSRGKLFLAEDIMDIDAKTVEESTPLLTAAAIMEKENVDILPVISDKRAVGILTRNELLKGFFKIEKHP